MTGVVEPYAVGVEDAKRSLGKFIIATNELDTQNLPAAAMLENYTDQGVSKGHLQPKDVLREVVAAYQSLISCS